MSKTYVNDPAGKFYHGREVEILETREIAGVKVHWVSVVGYSETATLEFALRGDKIEYREEA